MVATANAWLPVVSIDCHQKQDDGDETGTRSIAPDDGTPVFASVSPMTPSGLDLRLCAQAGRLRAPCRTERGIDGAAGRVSERQCQCGPTHGGSQSGRLYLRTGPGTRARRLLAPLTMGREGEVTPAKDKRTKDSDVLAPT